MSCETNYASGYKPIYQHPIYSYCFAGTHFIIENFKPSSKLHLIQSPPGVNWCRLNTLVYYSWQRGRKISAIYLRIKEHLLKNSEANSSVLEAENILAGREIYSSF